MNNSSHTCAKCGMTYNTTELAESCEQWCQEHHSCNIDIIKNALPKQKVTK